MQGKLPQDFFPFDSQGNQNFAAVMACAMPFHITTPGQPVYQFDHAVMANLQTLGQISNAWLCASGEPLDRQQQLVLPWLESGLFRGLLAEMKELADLKAEFSQSLVVVECPRCCHP